MPRPLADRGRRRPGDVRPAPPSRRCVLAAAGSAVAAGLTLALWPGRPRAAAGPTMPPPPVRFDVVALGNVIGQHRVDFETAGEAFTAQSRIDVDARVLGVRLFHYRQDTRETWSGGRLQAFTSEGEDDGQAFRTEGRATPDGFVIRGRKGEVAAPADIMLATYWSPLMLTRDVVINPKRGNLKPQTVRAEGQTSIVIGGSPRAANRFAITGVLDGTVLYDDAGRWVGARFDRKGAAIEYRLIG